MSSLFASLAGRLLSGASILLVITVGILGLRLHSVSAERDGLSAWRDQVAAAARFAADRPKLGLDQVATQIGMLGQENGRLRAGIAQARANALDAKRIADDLNRQRKDAADDALPEQLARARAALARYADAHRVRKPAPSPAGGDRRCQRADLPSASGATDVVDRPGADDALDGSDWVMVKRTALEACTVIRERLVNARNWALGLGNAAEGPR